MPISPDQVVAEKIKLIPEEVFAVWDKLIAGAWNGSQSYISQETAVVAIVEAMDVCRQTVFDNKWLDIEDAYRAVGWKVEYDKAHYTDTYDSNFTFRKK